MEQRWYSHGVVRLIAGAALLPLAATVAGCNPAPAQPGMDGPANYAYADAERLVRICRSGDRIFRGPDGRFWTAGGSQMAADVALKDVCE